MALDESSIEFWRENGYLILRGAVDQSEIEAVTNEVERQWQCREGNKHVIDILTGVDANRELPLFQARDEHRMEAYKLNNLFLNVPVIRKVALSKKINEALMALLGGGVPINL